MQKYMFVHTELHTCVTVCTYMCVCHPNALECSSLGLNTYVTICVLVFSVDVVSYGSIDVRSCTIPYSCS